MAAVIVAIVGNAAEHGGAVVIARRGNIKLAAEIALASSAQVAVFLIPAVAIISWAIDPLSLAFRPVELGVLAAATVLTAILLRDGRSTTTKGIVLIVAYGLAALAFFLVGDRELSRRRGQRARAGSRASGGVDVGVLDSEVRGEAQHAGPQPADQHALRSDALCRLLGRQPEGIDLEPDEVRLHRRVGSTGSPASASPSASRRARAWSSARRST